MPTYRVETPQHSYSAIVLRGAIGHAAQQLPAKHGKVFVVTTEDVWRHQGDALARALAGVPYEVLHLPGGEDQKRLAPVEELAEQMVHCGGDRSSMVIAFGGGIVTDMAGFLAAIFMRGIPVLQIPTTLLAQVDAAIGGKTGVNLVSGKNLIGSFHQPLAVLIDPALLETLPEREYRAGLYEIVKAGIIREAALFRFLTYGNGGCAGAPAGRGRPHHRRIGAHERRSGFQRRTRRRPAPHPEFRPHLRPRSGSGDRLHALAARRGSGVGHARGYLSGPVDRPCLGRRCRGYAGDHRGLRAYSPASMAFPPRTCWRRLVHDKKTIQGKVHFVLPVRIGEVTVVSGIAEKLVLEAIRSALA